MTLSITSGFWTLAPSAVQAQWFWERLFRRERAEGQASGRASGGAVRDAVCSAEAIENQPLTALVPLSNEGDTVQAYPSFFFYVPFGSDEGPTLAEFMLLDEDQRFALEQPLRVVLPEGAGIVRLQLPTQTPGLAVGERYNWYFSILCDEWELSKNPSVSGWVVRVDTDTPETWYESLEAIAQQRQERLEEWRSLLQLYQLESVADEPIEDLVPGN